ncbi:MAG: hypothetical protein GF350_03995 [Chitinivibrionales bacterium]|nr:hypothetical protein [Chitinivibrionales bacterium]
MLKKFPIPLAIVCALSISSARSYYAEDTLLFTIKLTDKADDLFYCSRDVALVDILSGPVLVHDNRLLFYSRHGYVLYNQRGKIEESHSLHKKNRRLAPDDPDRLMLAYPPDKSTLLYYKNKKTDEVFEKKIARKRIKKLGGKPARRYGDLSHSHILNIAFNTLTSEMVERIYLKPGLIGFDPGTGMRYWSLEKRYTFTSPVIAEKEGGFAGFFPGLKAGEGVRIKKFLIEPLSVIASEDRRRYWGLKAATGSDRPEFYQEVFCCDEAGNILRVDTLVKQTIRETVLEKRGRREYTFERTAKWGFPPCVDEDGSLYYAVLDYQTKEIVVRKRSYFYYAPRPSGPMLEHELRSEQLISYEPMIIDYNPGARRGAAIPAVWIMNEDGDKRKAEIRDLTCRNHIVRLYRPIYRDITKKVTRSRSYLPGHVRAMQDSLSDIPTCWAPWSISVSNRRGVLRSFDYRAGDMVLCARVLNVANSGQVFVRVDLEQWAELVIFDPHGEFVNRLTFNRQYYGNRKDLVAVSDDGEVIEKDYECAEGGYRFFTWTPTIP